MKMTSTNPIVKAEIDKVENLIANLAENVDEVKSSSEFKAWLDMTARFHNYSYYNTILLMIQKPKATRVAGFKQWKDKFGRYVMKGEKGLSIFCPMFKNVEEENEAGEKVKENRLVGFRLVKVFDVAQTEGKALPENPHKRIGGDEFGGLYNELKVVAEKMGIVVTEKQLVNSCGGASSNGKIVINTENGLTDKAHVIAHEIAHEILYWNGEKASRETAELEAEAVAYVVSTSFGIDATYHSATYLASWKANKDGLKESMERIRNTAKRIIDGVNDIKVVNEFEEEYETAA